MKIIYLDDYNIDEVSIVFVKAYQSIFFEGPHLLYSPDTSKQILKKYLRSIPKDILNMLESDNPLDFDFRTHKYDVKNDMNCYNNSIYNLLLCLYYVDFQLEKDEDIILYLETDDIKDRDSSLLSKMDSANSASLGVSNFIIEQAQKHNSFSFNKHYAPAPGLGPLLKDARAFQLLKEGLEHINYEKEIALAEIKLLLELEQINKESSFIKMALSLLFIIYTPEFDERIKDLAYNMLDIINELTFCGKMQKLFIQARPLNESIVEASRGSEDATTRLSILFSANNNDIFCIRIDLPHAGEPFFHINLQELISQKMENTGFPLTTGEYYELVAFNTDYIKYFYEINNYYYFRTSFKDKVKNGSLSHDEKKYLYDLFDNRCHKEIKCNCEKNDPYLFTELWSHFLQAVNIHNFECIGYGKDDINYSEILHNIRIYDDFESHVNSHLPNNYLELINISQLFNAFKLKYPNRFKDDYQVVSTIDLWHFLSNMI